MECKRERCLKSKEELTLENGFEWVRERRICGCWDVGTHTKYDGRSKCFMTLCLCCGKKFKEIK